MRVRVKGGDRIEDYTPGLIRIEEDESVELIRSGLTVRMSFGIGWVALQWDEGEPMPETVRRLGLMRGVLNANMDGAGI